MNSEQETSVSDANLHSKSTPLAIKPSNSLNLQLGGISDLNKVNEELIWTELNSDPHSLWLNLIHLSRFGLVFGSKKKVDTLDSESKVINENQITIISNC